MVSLSSPAPALRALHLNGCAALGDGGARDLAVVLRQPGVCDALACVDLRSNAALTAELRAEIGGGEGGLVFMI